MRRSASSWTARSAGFCGRAGEDAVSTMLSLIRKLGASLEAHQHREANGRSRANEARMFMTRPWEERREYLNAVFAWTDAGHPDVPSIAMWFGEVTGEQDRHAAPHA
jgi:hypothetical protein